jgi:hypothetical protein
VDPFLPCDAQAVRLALGKQFENVTVDPVDVVSDEFDVTWIGICRVFHLVRLGAFKGKWLQGQRGWG